jgi:pyroglutamyl-peptidase
MAMAPIVLVTGFGSFGDVRDNPSGALARALDGSIIAGARVVGEVLDVSYARGLARLRASIQEHRPVLVLGFGVAMAREGVEVERWGRRQLGAREDVDGATPPDLGEGPDRVEASVDPAWLAHLLGGSVSEDAGTYLCNAWAWLAPQCSSAPAAFIHVPPQGIDVSTVQGAIEAFILLRSP